MRNFEPALMPLYRRSRGAWLWTAGRPTTPMSVASRRYEIYSTTPRNGSCSCVSGKFLEFPWKFSTGSLSGTFQTDFCVSSSCITTAATSLPSSLRAAVSAWACSGHRSCRHPLFRGRQWMASATASHIGRLENRTVGQGGDGPGAMGQLRHGGATAGKNERRHLKFVLQI